MNEWMNSCCAFQDQQIQDQHWITLIIIGFVCGIVQSEAWCNVQFWVKGLIPGQGQGDVPSTLQLEAIKGLIPGKGQDLYWNYLQSGHTNSEMKLLRLWCLRKNIFRETTRIKWATAV